MTEMGKVMKMSDENFQNDELQSSKTLARENNEIV